MPNAKTLPFSVFVPDLSVTLLIAPPARPNSASYALVLMFTVSIASADGISVVSSPVRWLSSIPSIWTLLARRDWPLTLAERLSWALKKSECGRWILSAPGTVITMPWKLRLKPSGTSARWMLSMMRLVSARSVCSSGLSPTTVIDSSRAPTSSLRSTRTVALTGTSTPSRTTRRKPLSSPETWYVPSFRFEKT